jgi:hypothetical protein
MKVLTTLPQPAVVTTGYKHLDRVLRFISTLVWVFLQIPWSGIKLYPTVFLLAISAAYASSQFAGHRGLFPFPLNYAQAIAFELVYLGAIAMAHSTNKWFKPVVISGALTSASYIVLYALQHYQVMHQIQTLIVPSWYPVFSLSVTIILAVVHGLPLTGLGLLYNFLIHQHLREIDEQEKERLLREKFTCPYGCGASYVSERQLSGHKAHCPNKPQS